LVDDRVRAAHRAELERERAGRGFPTTLDAISASGPDDVWIVGSYVLQVRPTALEDETYSLHPEHGHQPRQRPSSRTSPTRGPLTPVWVSCRRAAPVRQQVAHAVGRMDPGNRT
jgi:hypothetical protein